MQRGFSIYLDLIRILAAFNVFFCHAFTFKKLVSETPAWAWWSHESVIIFFVLSGLVIAHVASTKDRSLDDYVVSRLVRIYSVVIPAIIVSFLADRMGMLFDPEFYAQFTAQSMPVGRILVSFFFLNESWTLTTKLFSNQPYWSIPYEVFYYILFACAFYLKGAVRIFCLAACALLAGPKILLLFPVWLLGVLVYKEQMSKNWSPFVHWALFLLPFAFFAAYAAFRLNVKGGDLMQAIVGPDIFRNVLTGSRYAFADTALGIAIAVHFIGAKNLSAPIDTIIHRAERPIRWLSSYTFSIYLMHFPLLFLFTLALDNDPASPLTPWLAIVPTLAVIFVISFLTEQQRYRIKPAISRLWLIWIKPPLRRVIYALAGANKVVA